MYFPELLTYVIPNIAALLASVIGALAAVYQVRFYIKRRDIEKEISEGTGTERQILVSGEGNTVHLPAPSRKEKTQDLLDFQLALLKEYHQTGLAQSRTSFLFSIIFASLGFSLIALSVVIVMQADIYTEQGAAANSFGLVIKPAVTLISGTIIDVVAGLFFIQSNKARQLMTEFFDKLRADRKLDEALNLLNSIEDKETAGKAKAFIALQFSGAGATDEQFKTIVLPKKGEIV